MLTDAVDAAAAEVAAVEEGAALAAFHLIDSDQDRYITQGDLLRTFGMHLDKRAMQRMLEKIDWRTNRMNFEQFQLLLAENRMSDKERGVLEYTSALEHISKKGEFAYKKAGAEEKAAAEKAAAEKAAADNAAAEKAAAEKAAAENAETEKAPFTPPQSSSMSSSWATEKAAAEKADADKAAAEKAFAIGKEIGKTLSSVFVESPVALFKSITSGKYVEDEKADPDEAAFAAIQKAAEEGKATAEKAAAEKVAAAKKVNNIDDEDGDFDLCDDLWDERSPWKSPATRKTAAAAEKAAAAAAGKALQEEAFSWEAFVEVVCALRKETPTISDQGILAVIKSQYEVWPIGAKEVRDAISLLLAKEAAEKAAAGKAAAEKAE
eukprot:jgi/Chrpa1/4362/Chrysochromulina_OHIO_Genome00016505-RA